MNRFQHTLAALNVLASLGLAHCAVISDQNGAPSYTAFFALASVLLLTASALHARHRKQLRAAQSVLDRPARRPRVGSVEDGVVAVALAGACCERWWTSAGAEHEPTTCIRKDTSA
ncbi:hypothetical protein PV735_11260 [Streptomyces turgidiscabies]|uniref:Uncharacterized protein n=1 Tax=Streptomyces turgidiscabies (strain Car8) TaxID=698760 RepID=L7ETN7_STRT8|nr:hypothetical protein [Streptomyces turgidiscabies]ELP61760.1 hypothetical protein STRTUCAR8_06430 [Streptomyces turgidiscabies Car8]MDX3493262.1 hypothetical protein [Streptomyces turgidiscabies]GAQ70562.1 hypothetical protein T45_02298 [Streptomyces turgidiscabies]